MSLEEKGEEEEEEGVDISGGVSQLLPREEEKEADTHTSYDERGTVELH